MVCVSFVIPSYNSFLTIEKTIRSILGQKSFECVKEVLVIDSSVDDKTRPLLKQFDHPRLKVIEINGKTTPSSCRNAGAAAAAGDLLCFIDSDVYLSDDWLENVLVAYRTGCRMGCGSVSVPEYQKDNHLALAQLYLQFNESLNVGETRPVSMVPACDMFVERVLFEKAGGFPDLRAAEDVMFCLKVGESAQVWFVPSARCFHMFRENYQSYYNNQIVLGKYIIIYRRKVYPRWYYKGLWPLLFLPAFLIIKTTRIKWRILKSGWGHTCKYVVSAPLFAVGLYYWAVGFVQGCFSKE